MGRILEASSRALFAPANFLGYDGLEGEGERLGMLQEGRSKVDNGQPDYRLGARIAAQEDAFVNLV